MSFYPLLKAPGCRGKTTLCNFSPNNWEYIQKKDKLIYVTWADGEVWRSINIGELRYNQTIIIDEEYINKYVSSDALMLLSITDKQIAEISKTIPVVKSPTTMPAWRGSLGLENSYTSTSYQGEVDPFPAPGTLLSFCPFLQTSRGVSNYLLLLNVEQSPQIRTASVEILNAKDQSLKGKFVINNNSINVIPLDNLGFTDNDLVVNISRDMCAIPIYFTITDDGRYMSLEHTHPPASMVVHGNRWAAQKLLKQAWFELTEKNED